MELEDTKIFTGIPEVDTHTLDQLDNKTLYDVCQVNQYAYELCLNDITLRNRIKAYLHMQRPRGGLRYGVMEQDVLLTARPAHYDRLRRL